MPGVRGWLLLAWRIVLLRALRVRAPPAVARLALVTVLAEIVESLRAGLGKVVVVLGVMQ